MTRGGRRRMQCDATHRVLGRCNGDKGHPNLSGVEPSEGHGSSVGNWYRWGDRVHWNLWAGTAKRGQLMGGDDYDDGRRIERFADRNGHVGETVMIDA